MRFQFIELVHAILCHVHEIVSAFQCIINYLNVEIRYDLPDQMKIKTAAVYNDRGTEFKKLLNLGFYLTALIQLFDIKRLIALFKTAILLHCRIAIK